YIHMPLVPACFFLGIYDIILFQIPTALVKVPGQSCNEFGFYYVNYTADKFEALPV
ncbi:Hypothetical protein FKW44_024838, partial [Caligus rogercresseyi]